MILFGERERERERKKNKSSDIEYICQGLKRIQYRDC